MDWTELHQKCIKLLEDPSLRVPNDELKYLNIDYTQFDEWSSDEEINIFTGIEKGYEKWLAERVALIKEFQDERDPLPPPLNLPLMLIHFARWVCGHRWDVAGEDTSGSGKADE